jgi:transaldolase
VTGATSNPTIFVKAITGSDLYDEQLRALAAGGERGTQELFFALALDDVREAARELLPAFDAAAGATGSSPSSAPPNSPTTASRRSRRRPSSGSGSIG